MTPERCGGRPADRTRFGAPGRDLGRWWTRTNTAGPPANWPTGTRGLAGAEGLKTSVTDLLIAGKVELQHQGGAIGAEDRDELVSEAAGEPLRCETARRHG